MISRRLSRATPPPQQDAGKHGASRRVACRWQNETNIVLKETLDTLCICKIVLYRKGWVGECGGFAGGGGGVQGNNITISLVQCMHNRLLFSLCIW